MRKNRRARRFAEGGVPVALGTVCSCLRLVDASVVGGKRASYSVPRQSGQNFKVKTHVSPGRQAWPIYESCRRLQAVPSGTASDWTVSPNLSTTCILVGGSCLGWPVRDRHKGHRCSCPYHSKPSLVCTFVVSSIIQHIQHHQLPRNTHLQQDAPRQLKCPATVMRRCTSTDQTGSDHRPCINNKCGKNTLALDA